MRAANPLRSPKSEAGGKCIAAGRVAPCVFFICRNTIDRGALTGNYFVRAPGESIDDRIFGSEETFPRPRSPASGAFFVNEIARLLSTCSAGARKHRSRPGLSGFMVEGLAKEWPGRVGILHLQQYKLSSFCLQVRFAVKGML
jgi:hypothetical protein